MTACKPRCPVGACTACDAARAYQVEYKRRRRARDLAEIIAPQHVDREWHDLGLCREIDPDLWFPEKGGSTRDAKKVCGRCPVQAQCLQQALDAGERFGIWGGVSERDRRRMESGRAA